MFDQSEAEAMCLCGCGERTHAGSNFLPGHDRKAEKKILDIHYGGSVLGLLHFHNYRSGAELQGLGSAIRPVGRMLKAAAPIDPQTAIETGAI